MGIVRTIVIILSALSCFLADQDPSWISLFDGKALTGWHVAARSADLAKEFWKVQDGTITCDSRGRKNHDYVWLIYNQEFADFELRLKVRSYGDSTGNSGVQVRSRYDSVASWMNGPQVDIHPPAAWRTGLIYDETRETRRWIHPSLPDSRIDAKFAVPGWTWKHSGEGDGWNAIQIVCDGTRIRTIVNGLQTADFDGRGLLDDEAHKKHSVGLRGHIALQLHVGDDLFIQYKDIEIKPLR